jgi:hypothetical protein
MARKARLVSSMSGNGGRASRGMGGITGLSQRGQRSARRTVKYAAAITAGERHKGHKFSQARYESTKLGW